MTPIWRVSVAFIAYYAATGAAWPYLPIYYHTLGLSLSSIGVIAALGAAVQLVAAPAWGALADICPRTRLTIPVAAFMAAGGAAVLAGAHDVLAVYGGAIVLSAGLAGVAPVLDARAMETLGAERIRYGRVRALGSASFIVVAMLAGVLIDRSGVASLFVVYVPTLVITGLVAATLTRVPTARHVGMARGVVVFVTAPGMRLFLIGAFLVGTSLVAANAFYSLRLAALGAPAHVVGLSWAIGSVIEVPLMWSYPRIARHFGTSKPLLVGAGLFALRAGIAATATDPLMLLAVAPIEGMAFGLFYVGGVTFIAERAPSGMGATAQGVFTATGGLASIVGSLLGGFVADALTIPGLFATCAGVSAIAAAVIAVAIRGSAMPEPVPPHPSSGGSGTPVQKI